MVRQDGGRRRVIFLDMDGVISTWRAHKAQPEKPLPDRWIDAEAMANLNRLCEQSGASVVISSTWRLNRTREEFQTILSRNGFTGALHHCWRTKDMAAPIGSGGLWWAVIRGDEVRAWLSDHPAEQIERHVILDDDSDFHSDQPLVRTDFQIGLTEAHVAAALALLAAP